MEAKLPTQIMSAAVSRVNDPDSEHLSHDVPYQGQLDVIWQTGHLFMQTLPSSQ